MALTKYVFFVLAFLIINGIMMSPINNNQVSSAQELTRNGESEKNGYLESLMEKEAALMNLRRKLNGNYVDEDDSSSDDITNVLDEQDLEELADELGDNDYDGKIISKKSAPRRIFIGKRLNKLAPPSGGKRNGQIHRIFIGKRGDIKRIFIG